MTITRPPCARLPWFAAFALLAALVAAFAARPEPAAAHPLGNFTINRYARLEPGATAVRVVYALDMAEIPTYQEMNALDRDRDGRVSDDEREAWVAAKLPEIARNLKLTVHGSELTLTPELGEVTLSEGQGGLQVLRLDAVLTATLPSGARSGMPDARLRDTNYDGRLGWREIVVRGTTGAAVRESSVSSEDVSDALRAYPESSLQKPLDVREARFRFEPGVADPNPAPGATTSPTVQPARRQGSGAGVLGRFADSAARETLTLPVVVALLAAAVFWGALHALSPGHGKTVVAAYLVGSRGTARHAVFLGMTVTATHTAGVYLLGLITLFASHLIVPEKLYPILSLGSGLVVVGMGLSLLWSRLRSGREPGKLPVDGARAEPGQHHSHGFGGGHSHGPDSHHHAIPGQDGAPVTWRSLLALGIYGGLIPCPTAIVVLLTSISLGRVGFGMLLVVAFSLGLAGVLVGIGVALVFAGRAVSRIKIDHRIARAVPLLSAAAVVAVGVLITLRAVGVGVPAI